MKDEEKYEPLVQINLTTLPRMSAKEIIDMYDQTGIMLRDSCGSYPTFTPINELKGEQCCHCGTVKKDIEAERCNSCGSGTFKAKK